MVFVADDLGAWLTGLLANAGRRKLTTFVLGTDQERALRSAATAAVEDTCFRILHGEEELAIKPRRDTTPVTRLYVRGKDT
jgi:hypothetical protein